MKILSVDDDPFFLEIMKTELTTLGYSNFDQVSSGAAAIAKVQSEQVPYDCFLLDIDMPGMTGVELAAHLRAEPAVVAGVPIIMVTARTEMESVDKAFAAGATDYLNKPLSRRELRGRLQMAEKLTGERAARVAAGQNAQNPMPEVGDAIRLEHAPAFMDFIAMQNYVLKLGSMRMFKRIAVGVNMPNINDIFATKNAVGIEDTLTDVAELLVEVVGNGPKVISYAGSGNFVMLLNRVASFDQAGIAEQLGLKLATLAEWYGAVGEIAPTLRLGAPVSRGLISFMTPEEILMAAIQSARRSGVEVKYRPDMGAVSDGGALA